MTFQPRIYKKKIKVHTVFGTVEIEYSPEKKPESLDELKPAIEINGSPAGYTATMLTGDYRGWNVFEEGGHRSALSSLMAAIATRYGWDLINPHEIKIDREQKK